MKRFFRKKRAAVVCMALVALAVCGEPASAQRINGEIETVQGKKVLHLWGNNYEMGYAHGYLLADDIIDLLDNYMLEKYDLSEYAFTNFLLEIYVRLPVDFYWEIEGMYDGMVAARAEKGIYSKKIGRDFKAIDLIRWNMFEIFPLRFEDRKRAGTRMCSSVSAWGEGTPDGSTIMARNLDFGAPGDLIERSSMMIAYEQQWELLPKKQWLSFGWPGFIGCMTGMNEDGVCAAVHYGNSNAYVEDLMIPLPWSYTPVGFVLREAIETRWYGLLNNDPISEDFMKILSSRNAGSFNIHVITPNNAPTIRCDPPAAVIEGNDRETWLRTSWYNQLGDPRLFSNNFLAVTNHHRAMRFPIPCGRYEILVDELNDLQQLDMATALVLAKAVVQTEEPYHTAQILGFNADTREMWISFGDGHFHPYEIEPVHFYWTDIFD